MSNIKAGDKVRLVNYIGDESDKTEFTEIGREMVVISIHENTKVPFPVNTEEGLWAYSELELVE